MNIRKACSDMKHGQRLKENKISHIKKYCNGCARWPTYSTGPQAVPDQPITAPYFAHGKYHCMTANGLCTHGKYNYRIVSVHRSESSD